MDKKHIHVVAAVIYDQANEEILIAKRPVDKHQGGKWEFPGGKVESSELAQEALYRELDEELGIQIAASRPLIQIYHEYVDKSVFLDVYEVSQFLGDAYGKEGQEIRWVRPRQLEEFTFPAANVPILRAINLPDVCLITPNISPNITPSITPNLADKSKFLKSIDRLLKSGLSLLQFRAKQIDTADYIELATSVIEQAHGYDAKVLLNSPPEMLPLADGLHLTSYQLMSMDTRPILAEHQTLSASCHNEEELMQASKIQADFVFLSPVKETSSHPEVTGMGWENFQQLSTKINVPVYALGGLAEADLSDAKENGAQGIAAISGLWDKY